MELAQQLHSGLEALGEDPSQHPCSDYLAYIDLLAKWNQAYNLSGIKQKEKTLSHHLLDCLSVLPYLRGDKALDVGSGAGLPGFILALARPEMEWVLMDSNSKKTRFLRQALLELKPANIEIAETRFEDYPANTGFNNIICRALMPAKDFCVRSLPHLQQQGRIVLMKSKSVAQEIEALDSELYQLQSHSLQVPGVDAERLLLIIERRQ